MSIGLLARYVIKTTTLAMLGSVAVLVFLQVLFNYLAELGELNAHYSAFQALQRILWDVPTLIMTVMPIAILMGSVIGLGGLASSSELVVMRSAGVSLWRIVGWTLLPALLLIVSTLALAQWVIPYTSQQASTARRSGEPIPLGEVRGYWTREGQRVVHIDYANANGELRQVRLFDFDARDQLSRVISADSGNYRQGQWTLQQVRQVTIQPDGSTQLTQQVRLPVQLSLQPRFVHMVTVNPEELAPSDLISYISYLQSHSQVPKKYLLALWKMIGLPFATLALLLLACSFVFGPLRQQSMSFRMVIALFCGLGFNYLQEFMGYASLIYRPSAGWFVFLPIVMIAGLGAYLLRRVR